MQTKITNLLSLKRLKIALKILAVFFILFATIKTYFDLSRIKREYFLDNHSTAVTVNVQISDKLKTLYESIRIIARLPSVRKVSEPNFSLNKDSTTSIQEIYNNLFLNLRVSEIYIYSSQDKGALKPRARFEEFISTSENNGQSSKSKINSEIPEIEEFEYLQVEKQINFFKHNYPRIDRIKNLNYPMQISQLIITCDNTLYNPQKPNDLDRSGYVFSVPIYNSSGYLAGVVSAVLLNSVLEDQIPNQAYAIFRDDINELVTRRDPKFMLDLLLENVDSQESLIYFDKIPIALPFLNEKWTLISALPNSTFWSTTQVRIIFIIYIFSILAVISAYFISLKFQKSNEERAQWMLAKNNELTLLLEEAKLEALKNAKMAGVAELSGQIAHEINSPLAALMMTTDRVLMRIETKSITDDFLLEKMNFMKDIVKRIANITDSMRRLATGAIQSRISATTIGNIIQDTKLITEPKLKSTSTELHIEYVNCDDSSQINCRSTEIGQVLINLINNACYALAKSPSKALAPVDRNIFFTITKTETSMQFKIQDNGPGIPKNALPKLFVVGFSTKGLEEGSGFGLSISKRIAKEHGGDLIFDEHESLTTFILTLPLKK